MLDVIYITLNGLSIVLQIIWVSYLILLNDLFYIVQFRTNFSTFLFWSYHIKSTFFYSWTVIFIHFDMIWRNKKKQLSKMPWTFFFSHWIAHSILSLLSSDWREDAVCDNLYNQMRRRQHFSIPMSNFLENLLISGDFHHLICRTEMRALYDNGNILFPRKDSSLTLLNVNWNFEHLNYNCHPREFLVRWALYHRVFYRPIMYMILNDNLFDHIRFLLFHLPMNMPKLISWSVHHVIHSTTNWSIKGFNQFSILILHK